MTQPHWSAAKPWHTNAALIALGFGLICITRRLIVEYDTTHNYWLGFDGCSTISLALFIAAALILLLKPANVDRYTFPIILTIAIACRIVALFPDPALSSDVYRYAWDGVVQHAGINPYRYVPGNPALTFLRAPNQDLFDNMNRRDYAHTIYPPVAQMCFYLISFLSPLVTGMKLGMIFFEALTMVGLAKLFQHLGRPREWLILYAWFPLCIWEFAGSGHLDAIVMAFITLALLFRCRRQPVLTGLFFGLAVFTKFYPLVLFPALYQRRPDGKLDWKMPATFTAVGILCYLPYLSVGKGVFGFLNGYVDEEGMASGTRYFLLDLAQHLPGLHQLPQLAFIAFAGVVFLSLTIWAWKIAVPNPEAEHQPNPEAGCPTLTKSGSAESPRHPTDTAFLPPALGLALALMLLFSPHYPWYVAWLVVFFALIPSLTLFTYIAGLFYLCTTALAVGFGPEQYHLNKILYSAVLVAFIVEVTLRRLPQTRAWFTRLSLYPNPQRPL